MKDKPKIGDLRHLVSLQNSTNTADGAGGFTQSYSTIADVFASINPKKGNEIFSDEHSISLLQETFQKLSNEHWSDYFTDSYDTLNLLHYYFVELHYIHHQNIEPYNH